MSVLVTGGCGYIGSHIVLELLEKNTPVVVVDNLCNSTEEPVHKVSEYTGKTVQLYIFDVCDREKLSHVFEEHKIKSVIHLAGLKAVGESYDNPLMYYNNNLRCTISLLAVMEKHGVKNIIFSSSATVYGNPKFLPLTEDHPIGPTNPYGQTKRMIEQMLEDIHKADSTWNITILRYFNPVGAHPSGIIGDNPKQPNNLLPYVLKVITKELPHLNVFGNDYKTKDGTGVRDYIHVQDLALGHIQALNGKGLNVYNLGTGIGYSVMEVLKTIEKLLGKPIPYKNAPRRKGDVAIMYADARKAREKLGWTAHHSLPSMCCDALNYLRLTR
jgi:UDP-glucose 4-epimerase